MDAISRTGSAAGWARLAIPAAVTMTLLSTGLLIGWVVLAVTMPAAVPSDDASSSQLLTGLPLVTMAATAFLLTARRPQNPVGWLLGVSVVFILLLLFGSDYGDHWLYVKDLPTAWVVPLELVSTLGWAAGFPMLLVLLPLVFPDGHLLSGRWLPVVWFTVALAVITVAATTLDPTSIGDAHRNIPNPLGVPGAHELLNFVSNVVDSIGFVGSMAIGVVAVVIRYRRAGSDLRHQLKWFVAAIAVAVVAMVIAQVNSFSTLGFVAITIGFTALPVSIGIAVLKYRLYDIDVVISRTLVYGSLAAFITAVYVGIVVGIGTLVGAGGKPNLLLSIVATAIVAVGFQPVRERLQRIANRLVYGKRATPYEVLSQFSERVAETYAADEALPRMARVLAEGTGAERAQVWLRTAGALRPAAAWPDLAVDGAMPEVVDEPVLLHESQLPALPGDRAVAVMHQGELLGALTITKRQGESLTPVEEKLLADLAAQAGLVLKNVGLTAELLQRLEELRASRQRLVAAQDDERRRLERNLHDGAQQNLVALKVKLGLAEMLAEKDPDRAKALLSELKGDTDETLDTLRDLARGIYPPLLADKGLLAALEAQARKATLPVSIDGDGLGRYPQEVEAAVYFCVLEALQNVQKYAGATSAVVRLWEIDHYIDFEVVDDGRGFDPAKAVRGAGLTNMNDRLDALGGSFTIASEAGRYARVSGRLPLPISTMA